MKQKARTQNLKYQQPHSARPHEEPASYQPPMQSSPLPRADVDPYRADYHNERTQIIRPNNHQYAHPRSRAQRNGRKLIYLSAAAIIIALVLVAIGVLAVLPRLHTTYSRINNGRPPAILSVPGVSNTHNNQSAPNLLNRGNNIVNSLRNHTTDIKTQLAKELKLSDAQLTQDLQNGQTIAQIASNQGLNNSQQQQLISNALHSALQTEVTNGGMTQDQLDMFIERVQENPVILNHLLL
ncbi:hypothetical protein [Ktedonospora formicarum]|uniref:Uncharacterized protein n=1 Tax=Ktedonospora formicarum TaxID=2778364 RepID=A0A8J3HVT3_9CHLR|nr:hypothetical protein [Ktedonospora formicarum]GHO44684.1 hypothetical protein KSX_28470 [Ktedonospora formicarum]